MIEIIKDIPLIQDVHKYDVLLVGTNIYGRLSNGFQFDVAEEFSFVKVADVNTRYGDIKKMGTILECQEGDSPIFVLMYITKGYNFQPHKVEDYLDYESLERCLELVNIKYKGKTIASTIPGSYPWDGNGNKDKIIDIINKTLTDVNIYLYDYEEISRKAKQSLLRYKKMCFIHAKDREGHKQFIEELKEIARIRREKQPNFDK